MGFVHRKSFGKDFVPLSYESRYCLILIICFKNVIFSSEFYNDLYKIVDQSSVRLQETVLIFFVREGQRVAADILRNNVRIYEQDKAGLFLNNFFNCQHKSFLNNYKLDAKVSKKIIL